MKRELGKFETASAISGEFAVWNIVGVLLLETLPSPESIHQSLNTLQKKHPFLRARLIINKGRYYFESGDIPSIRLDIFSQNNENHWMDIAEDELNFKFDHQTGPLMRCTILQGAEGQGEIILTAQHSIVDGVSMETIFHELMELVVKIESGEDAIKSDSLNPMPPLEKLFPEGFQGFELQQKTLGYFLRQMGDEFTYQFSLRGKRKPPIELNPRARILQFKTPIETTLAVASKARNELVTINSLANAAILLSVQKHLYDGEEMPFRYMAMADLRPYLDPTPPHDQIASYISPLRYTIQVSAKDELWSLAGRINRQIYESSKRGEKYLAAVMSYQFLKMTFTLKKFRMCTTAVSYGSATKLRKSYGPYRIKRLHGFVSNFGLGPEFSGRVELHGDQLWWDMIYLDSDMDHNKAQLIADEINHILDKAIS